MHVLRFKLSACLEFLRQEHWVSRTIILSLTYHKSMQSQMWRNP